MEVRLQRELMNEPELHVLHGEHTAFTVELQADDRKVTPRVHWAQGEHTASLAVRQTEL